MKMKNAQTLNDNRDFVRIYRRGQCQVAPLLVTYACQRPAKVPPALVTGLSFLLMAFFGIGRGGGPPQLGGHHLPDLLHLGPGAVQRNRAKRLIRAAWREVEREAPSGWDYIFVARGRTPGGRMIATP